eukprot:3491916-Prymnesium_polylepis.1
MRGSAFKFASSRWTLGSRAAMKSRAKHTPERRPADAQGPAHLAAPSGQASAEESDEASNHTMYSPVPQMCASPLAGAARQMRSPSERAARLRRMETLRGGAQASRSMSSTSWAARSIAAWPAPWLQCTNAKLSLMNREQMGAATAQKCATASRRVGILARTASHVAACRGANSCCTPSRARVASVPVTEAQSPDATAARMRKEPRRCHSPPTARIPMSTLSSSSGSRASTVRASRPLSAAHTAD